MVREYDGARPRPAPPRRLPPRAAERGDRPRARARCSTRRRSCSSSGATPIVAALPTDHLERPHHVRRGRRRSTPRAGPASARAGRRGSRAARRPARQVGRRRSRGCAVLILGLESATAQVGCAIGGHEGVLASSHSARGRRHAENLTPVDRVRLPPGPGRAEGDQLRRGRPRAGSLHRPAGRRRRGQGHRHGAAGPDDRRVEPRPAGVPAPASPTGASSRSSTPAAARCSGPATSPSPAGVQRVTRAGCVHARRARRRAAGAARREAARRGRRRAVRRACSPTAPTSRSAAATTMYPSARALVQLAHAQALREEWVRPDGDRAALPPQARRRDQLVDPRGGPDGPGCCRPRHRAHATPPPAGRPRHRGAGVARDRGRSASSEYELGRSEPLLPRGPRTARRSSATPGVLLDRRRGPRHERRRRPVVAPAGRGHEPPAASCAGRRRSEGPATSRSRSG